MFTFLAGLILVVAAQDEDLTQDYAKLYQELIDAESYSFEVVVENKGGGFGGARRGGRGGTQEPTKTVGKFQKEKPYLVKSGETEAYRLDDMMVYREAEGEWKFYDPEEMMNSFRNRGDRGEGRGEGRGESRRSRPSEQDMIERFDTDGDGVLSDEERATARETLEKERAEAGEGDRAQRDQGRNRFGGMRALMTLNRSTLPHETVKKLIGQVTDITKSEAEEKVLFKGTLTKEGAKALASQGSTFGRRGGFGGGEEPAFDYSGNVELIIAAEGAIEKIVITTKTSGEFMDRTFESTRTTTIMVSDLGKVEMEVPEEAMSLFVI